ncbi:MAG: 16S rRNA (guanine(966)-N(2))-methyltransferase RsmD [Eubacterium sp.]|nr:16S rRNA (guanine(966)-N(2))-methyltransferase RsmD [Eubacterium sp.]
MRIIAGTAKSLPLRSIEGRDTRPTTDRIKETLFNILQTGIEGCSFLDLFAGSGQIGLEALSRGASHAVFVESSKKACACIEENIRFTRFDARAKLLSMEASGALRTLEGNDSFDYIFMDPPYQSGMEQEVLIYLAGSGLLKEDGVIIIEAAADTDFSYVSGMGLKVIREKKYKTNKHIFVTKEA